jgi:hypothetical protein
MTIKEVNSKEYVDLECFWKTTLASTRVKIQRLNLAFLRTDLVEMRRRKAT